MSSDTSSSDSAESTITPDDKNHTKKLYKASHLPLTPRKSHGDIDVKAVERINASILKTQLPPTPDATPSLPSRSRKHSLTDAETSPSAGRQRKRRAAEAAQKNNEITIKPSIRKYLFPLPPSSSKAKTSLFKKRKPSAPNVPSISAIELKRVSESILSQIDWKQVTEYVAGNRPGTMYKAVVKAVLQQKVDTLYSEEAEREQDDG